MDKALVKEINAYVREVKSYLLCDSKTKKKFTNDFRNNIFSYIDDADVSDIDIIRKHFGNPEQIAKSFFLEMDIKTVKKRLTIKRIISVSLIIVVAIIFGTAISICLDSYTSAHGKDITTLYDEDGNVISETYEQYY